MSSAEGKPGRRGRGRYRRWIAVSGGATIVVVALAAVGTGVAGVGPLSENPASGSGQNGAARVALAAVTRQTLSDRVQKNGTLGYAGSYSVVNPAVGTVTALPTVGDVIDQGGVLYRVSGAPVVLLLGTVPAYRALSKGMSGPDVRQLNAALVALGTATSGELDPESDDFTSATVRALKKLQDSLDVDQTGSLPLGQAVFLPSAARITTVSGTLGAPAMQGDVVLEASSTTRVVVVELDATEQSLLEQGDQVTITLPDTRTTPGTVSSVGTVATKPSDGGGEQGSSDGDEASVPVTVTPTTPAETGTADQVSVMVSAVATSAENVLAVPVTALLALAGGGYAVEVDDAGTRHLVPVTLGLFDDTSGQVEVTGKGLAEGQRVVVPGS